ncbi:hypothetical protein BJD55_gp157 [Gordonia phage Yvonnetastic]|uniref:Uncharacterized protein n=1 Tax=Gordonia phage Yvonnetastic TaxID=1821566 RepID=A0A142K926_9CAUD|nr:hypothetical protein BJD55_gp157 [Gordonia phage Yvonnetastic]AMS02609.1 hypothetical protein SEA_YVONNETASTIC_65 [Gordonia phage Yvonnetastic]WKW86041.1 hypothetical protein SEA_JONJAMES_67 [Gordonia Phage JonJames]
MQKDARYYAALALAGWASSLAQSKSLRDLDKEPWKWDEIVEFAEEQVDNLIEEVGQFRSDIA